MAKSTPIQAIKQQAQQSQQSQQSQPPMPMPMPMPTYMPQLSDVQPMRDSDDSSVKDVLNSLNAETYVMAPMQPTQQQQQYSQIAPQMQQHQGHPNDPSLTSFASFDDPIDDTNDDSQPTFASPLAFLTGSVDLKLAAICAAVFITVSQIPLEKIVYTYISLDKFPFSEVIIKALLAGLIFFVLARLVLHV
jgi:hypothetical protein